MLLLTVPGSTAAWQMYHRAATSRPTRSPTNSIMSDQRGARCARPAACARASARAAGWLPRGPALAAWGAYWHRLAHVQPSPSRAPTSLTRARSARTQAQPRCASSPSCSCSAGAGRCKQPQGVQVKEPAPFELQRARVRAGGGAPPTPECEA